MPFKPLLLACLLCLSASSWAATQNNTAEAAGDLREIRQAISAAQTELKQKQAAQKNARATLERTRAALAKAQKELADINRRQRNTWQKLQKLQNELNHLKTEVTGTKAQVARLLAGQYRNQQPNAVALFLKNAEPGQKARYLQYSRYINTANEQVINNLIRQQNELQQQEKAIDAELARLKKIKAQKQAALAKLGRSRSAAQKESNRLSAQINSQTKRISNLRADEQRLNKLLADVAKRRAEQRRQEAASRKKAAEARLAAAEKARQSSASKPAQKNTRVQNQTAPKNRSNTAKKNTPKSNPTPSTPRSTLTAEDRALQPTATADTNQGGFSRMQGRLRRPVGGSITGRFGQSRPGGGTWKGVFFATSGAAVRSIAAGTVAYAGFLEGYGNTVVVDHGDDYVSVYSGLNSLSVGSGSHIGSGQTIGSSGSLPSGEKGLYLEIRYRRQPMNPLSWIR
ncbi:murein hydrolase activator EnvC family protein [Neisseria montereyensis]|uniref:Peptidoglycan DD-metalloendopeptidase family protein n=1 Tax=Neisseria montereyensis TaxID=2973938 RepID=A0ABT2FA29_9NEIS|nr:peptidoglycan DD-metalloendopeptidase family protein [Neisseria montereyensis]MCS4533059.1 peptidoglycan DD-metalloendopeptidase family protein [Neisseria montereyensis]